MAAELPSHLDNIKHSKSLIDLESHSEGVFGLDDYVLSFVFDDIVLVEFVDEVQDAIKRNGLYVPTNATTKAWRKGKVVLVGPSVQYCGVDDIVVFPNDKGASVANLQVEGYGKVLKGMFLSEQRLFGICKPIEQ
jgi:cellobiose-specific phosphotransferase system component IIB